MNQTVSLVFNIILIVIFIGFKLKYLGKIVKKIEEYLNSKGF